VRGSSSCGVETRSRCFNELWLVPAVPIAVGTVAAEVPRERSLELTGLAIAVLGAAAVLPGHNQVGRLIPSLAIAWFVGDSKQVATTSFPTTSA
jgi:hypothetical protein